MSSVKSGVDPELFENEIDDELKCSICLFVLRDACQIKCQHHFCRVCITSWVTDGKDECPFCRCKKITGTIMPARVIQGMLEKYKLKCPNWSHGCRQVIFYRDLDNHERTCRYKCEDQPGSATQTGGFISRLFKPIPTPPPSSDINVTVLINTRSKIVPCSSGDTVLQLKRKIYDIEGIQAEEQNLIFNAKVLDNAKKLSEYEVKNGSFLFFTEKYSGGA